MELLQRELNSVFMTFGDADTLVHPHFFSPVTFESQRSPGYFRIVASLVNLYFGSHHAYSLYARPLNLACYRLGQSGDSDVDAYHKFCKFISQAIVAPPWFWRSECHAPVCSLSHKADVPPTL